MKRILIIILFSFFSYFFLSYSSPRTAPVTLCTTIEQARGNHAIRNRKWEKGVLQRVCGVFQMYFFCLFFLTILSQRLTLSCRTVQVVKTLRELCRSAQKNRKRSPCEADSMGAWGGIWKSWGRKWIYLWITSRLNMYRTHPDKPGKGFEDWRTMETRVLVLDQIWVE